MMQFSFDLISDLHVETWSHSFDFRGQSTSSLCVVAGDVTRNIDVLSEVLSNLAQSYKAVVYVDGNDEHRFFLSDIHGRYSAIQELVTPIENVIYLRDKVAVIDGVAFVGCNGWWTYDFANLESYDSSKNWFIDQYKIDMPIASEIENRAMLDAEYLCATVQSLQTHRDVKEIVIVSHTVPFPELIEHDIELQDSHMLNCMGNTHLARALSNDTECKISTWCFGHYHNGNIDQMFKGIRYVSNPRGRDGTPWCKPVYYPKKISL